MTTTANSQIATAVPTRPMSIPVAVYGYRVLRAEGNVYRYDVSIAGNTLADKVSRTAAYSLLLDLGLSVDAASGVLTAATPAEPTAEQVQNHPVFAPLTADARRIIAERNMPIGALRTADTDSTHVVGSIPPAETPYYGGLQ
jgi:hypothetical protein